MSMINSVGVKNIELYSKRMKQFIDDVAVYPVSCEKLSAGRSDKEWLDGVLAGGAKIVQLRDKESKDNVLLDKARYFREKTKEAGALFMLNDRLDIALLSDADGMHVGQGDLPPEEIRKLASDIIIGLSCNTEKDVQTLGEDISNQCSAVSYYNIGPIYQTGTKEGLHTFLGPESIPVFSRHCKLPFTVMGGVKFSNIEELTENGAGRLGVVTAISQAEDIRAETRKWQNTVLKYRRG